MSSRYIARKYGDSRASRAPSVAADSWSRGSSQIREFDSTFSSRATTPTGDMDRPWSSASTLNYYANQENYNATCFSSNSRSSTPTQTRGIVSVRSTPLLPVRGRTPPLTGYTESLIKSSRKQRERSFSPTREHVATVRKVPDYQANSDYYRGKVKSIYEREPIFSEFVRNLPLTDLHATNSVDLSRLKNKFQYMLEDKWERKQLNDPSVSHDIAYKASGWGNYLTRSTQPASERLADRHRFRSSSVAPLPRITVYHRSTMPGTSRF